MEMELDGYEDALLPSELRLSAPGIESSTLRIGLLVYTRFTEGIERWNAEIMMRGALTVEERWAKRCTGSGDS